MKNLSCKNIAYEIRDPEVLLSPVVISSPHIGRNYSKQFLKSIVLDNHEIRSSEDAYVDKLIEFITKMGFDFFFGYNCQRQAHTYYPVHLYKNENRVHLNNDTIPPNTKLAKGANPFDSKSYLNFKLNEYAPDLMFKEMISFISENKQNPFFLYWATPIPHNPLQAPQKWIN